MSLIERSKCGFNTVKIDAYLKLRVTFRAKHKIDVWEYEHFGEWKVYFERDDIYGGLWGDETVGYDFSLFKIDPIIDVEELGNIKEDVTNELLCEFEEVEILKLEFAGKDKEVEKIIDDLIKEQYGEQENY